VAQGDVVLAHHGRPMAMTYRQHSEQAIELVE